MRALVINLNEWVCGHPLRDPSPFNPSPRRSSGRARETGAFAYVITLV
jgi:hypothetical protein